MFLGTGNVKPYKEVLKVDELVDKVYTLDELYTGL